MTRALRLASSAAVALVAASIALRLADPFSMPGPSISAIVPILWAVGALVVVGLTHSWAPTLGWAAVIVGSTAGALATAGYSGEVRRLGGETDLRLEALVTAVLLIPPVIAAAYAVSGQARKRVTATTWLVVGALTMELIARSAARVQGGELEAVLPEWLWLGVIAILATIGLVRDLAPALRRTRERLVAGEGGSGAGSALPALRVLVDELVPGRDVGRAEAVESERGRLAADLHAEVLPSLRRALAAAEAGGTVERLAADLRSAVDEVESLLAARRSIVLEEMGLVAGLEWLAERVEDRSTVRVEIEVGGSDGEVAAGSGKDGVARRLPRDVERAAFRVAQLALDNVVRHAPGSMARIAVEVQPASVELLIEDDGHGPPANEDAAARSGRRGIADMRAEARACGGVLRIGPRPTHGTMVVFRWPA